MTIKNRNAKINSGVRHMQIGNITPNGQDPAAIAMAQQMNMENKITADAIPDAKIQAEPVIPAPENAKKSDGETTYKAKSAPYKSMLTASQDKTSFKFAVNKDTGDVVIQVIDDESNEIVQQIPPKAILDSVAEIWKLAGIRVDKKV